MEYYSIAQEHNAVDSNKDPELQITVGHRSLADQNLFMSDEIPSVVGHDVWTIFLIVNHFTATMNKSLSDHNFVLSDQDGVLVGHMSFK